MSLKEKPNSVEALKKELTKLADKKQAANLQRFFKTKPGEYGAGDIFLGIKVPVQRQVAKKYTHLSLNEVKKILVSPIHELRLVALLILVAKYEQADSLANKRKIVDFYLNNRRYINNWDLVDLSVHKIIGDFLTTNLDNAQILDRLAASKNLWERRMAMVATYAFIRIGRAEETLRIARKLIDDRHDLIHKAVGWMLREVGKRVDRRILLKFLNQAGKHLPRTALRYALEHLPEKQRAYYLKR